jgi:hypothetical protein
VRAIDPDRGTIRTRHPLQAARETRRPDAVNDRRVRYVKCILSENLSHNRGNLGIPAPKGAFERR